MKSQLYWKIGGNFTLEFVGCVSLIYLVKLGSTWGKEEARAVTKFTLSTHKNYVVSLEKGALWIQGQATAASVLWGFTKLLHVSVLRFLLCHEEVGSRIRSHAGRTWCADVSLWLTGHFGCLLAHVAGLLFATFFSTPSCDRYTWLSSLEADHVTPQAGLKGIHGSSGLCRVSGPSFYILPFYSLVSGPVLSQNIDCPHSRK